MGVEGRITKGKGWKNCGNLSLILPRKNIVFNTFGNSNSIHSIWTPIFVIRIESNVIEEHFYEVVIIGDWSVTVSYRLSVSTEF